MEVAPYLHIVPWSHGGLEVNFCKFLTSAQDGVVCIVLWLLQPCRKEPLGSIEYEAGEASQFVWEWWREKSLLLSGTVLSAIQSIPSHLLFLIWEIRDKFIIFKYINYVEIVITLSSQKTKICTLSLCCRDCTWIFSFFCCTRLHLW